MDFDWDDTNLISAYENALSDKEKSRQIAFRGGNSPIFSRKQKQVQKCKPSTCKLEKLQDFAIGTACRAFQHEETSEAVIVSVLPNSLCRIKYLGYKNEALVNCCDLYKSFGLEAVEKQVENACRASQPVKGSSGMQSGLEELLEDWYRRGYSQGYHQAMLSTV